jgi:hypothetical protein
MGGWGDGEMGENNLTNYLFNSRYHLLTSLPPHLPTSLPPYLPTSSPPYLPTSLVLSLQR